MGKVRNPINLTPIFNGAALGPGGKQGGDNSIAANLKPPNHGVSFAKLAEAQMSKKGQELHVQTLSTPSQGSKKPTGPEPGG
jgi:hypothetical protein